MSVRNVDQENPFFFIGVTYYDSDGSVPRSHLDQIYELPPVATADFVIPYSDTTGGTANFLVEWGAISALPDPIGGTVMFGQAGSAGISFLSRGKIIDEVSGTEPSQDK